MALPRRRQPLQWIKAWFRRSTPPPTERQQAQALIRAVDAGGVPLNPARINQIARQLGLEVSRRAPVEDTLARIRAALLRLEASGDLPPTGRRSGDR